MTVTGPVPADGLGLTLPHEHLLIDLTRQVIQGGRINDLELLTAELGRSRQSAGRPSWTAPPTRSAATPSVSGSSPRRPASTSSWGQVCTASPTSAANGSMPTTPTSSPTSSSGRSARRRGDRHPARHHRRDRLGEDDHRARGARPPRRRTSPAPDRARDHHPHGTLAERTQAAPILEKEGVDPRRVVIGHCDTVPSPEYHLELAQAGAFVEFDTIRGDNDYDIGKRARLRRSLSSMRATSNDPPLPRRLHRGHLRALGGTGYTYVPSGFADVLRSRGLTDDDVHTLLVDNPRRALAGPGAG